MPRCCCLAACLLSLACLWAQEPVDDRDQRRVGVQPDGSVVVPTSQVLTPAGKQLTFPGRPVDLLLSEDGKELFVKNRQDLLVVDVEQQRVKQTLPTPKQGDRRPGFSVVGLVQRGNRLYASDAKSQVRVAERQADGSFAWGTALDLPKLADQSDPHPAGLAWHDDAGLWVTATRRNEILLIDVQANQVRQRVAVGVAPFMVLPILDQKLILVSNWGGHPPKPTDPQGVSSGTPIRVDPKTWAANDGTLSIVEPHGDQWRETGLIQVGLHPCAMVRRGDLVYVACANSDSVSVVSLSKRTAIGTISTKPDARLPFGSGANALALARDGRTLFVANGTNNAVAVVKLGRDHVADASADVPATSQVSGFIPVGWYPGALALDRDEKTLFVANIKGHGSLSPPSSRPKAFNSHDHLGSLSLVLLPTSAQLAAQTQQVARNNRLGRSLAGLEQPRPKVPPSPVPERHGEPSVFKHVIYIIKENRTYDQVFGALPQGKGKPELVLFGENVTPNHHALARQFTLFDNFYCSGVLSADGHHWTNEAYVTDYLERAFGGFTRSYPDAGEDPLAFAPSGFLWDNALRHGKSIRIYGEFTEVTYTPKDASWQQLYDDYLHGTDKVKISIKANIQTLAPYIHPRYAYFPLNMPDVYRAKMFIEELREFEQRGSMPNLMILSLPCDHATGTQPGFPTPRASVADNDLALGRIVEAVSRSRFWKETCIFVVEDDPQDGFDHVDAHRTVALVISPYTRRRFVDSTCYNQPGMVKTINLILGLPPLNQMDLAATPMRACFQPQPDLTPYRFLPNHIPLAEMNPELKKLKGQARYWAEKSLALDFSRIDAADENIYNRILWHAVKGDGVPYPVQYTRQGRQGAQFDEDD